MSDRGMDFAFYYSFIKLSYFSSERLDDMLTSISNRFHSKINVTRADLHQMTHHMYGDVI